MKQSGKSIQLKALNRILGNISDLDVQPYGLFVEEEQKKLNAHWSVCLLVEQTASFIRLLGLFIFLFFCKTSVVSCRLQLVKDLPAAYAIWKKLQSEKRDVLNSVGRELKDKLNPLMEV